MEKDDVKSQVTTMMICNGRNGNRSVFNVIMHHVVPSLMSRSHDIMSSGLGTQTSLSLSTTIGS